MMNKLKIETDLLYQYLRDLGYEIDDGDKSQEALSDELRDYARSTNYGYTCQENFVGFCADRAASRVISKRNQG